MTRRSRVQVKTGRAVVGTQRVASTPTITERALVELLLHSTQYRDAGYTASTLGAILWLERQGSVIAPHGGGDYAAQMLLGRMRKCGLVRVQPRSTTSVWELTEAGRIAAVRARQDWHHVLERRGVG